MTTTFQPENRLALNIKGACKASPPPPIVPSRLKFKTTVTYVLLYIFVKENNLNTNCHGCWAWVIRWLHAENKDQKRNLTVEKFDVFDIFIAEVNLSWLNNVYPSNHHNSSEFP